MPGLKAKRESHLLVFAYGSNLFSPRILARVQSAIPVVTGYVEQRKIAFHKRSEDGSAKADAVFTSLPTDKLWGVVYQLPSEEKPVLDQHEFLGIGYDEEEVEVIAADGKISAWMYVARPGAIDSSLLPYRWYLDYVIAGAHEHGLPETYIDGLNKIESIVDPDLARRDQNRIRLVRTIEIYARAEP